VYYRGFAMKKFDRVSGSNRGRVVHSTRVCVGDTILVRAEGFQVPPYIAEVMNVFQPCPGTQSSSGDTDDDLSPRMTLRWYYRTQDLHDRFSGHIPARVIPKGISFAVSFRW